MINYKEIELKYRADDIPLTAFLKFAKDRSPVDSLYVSGYDHFFSDTAGSESFVRHRVGHNFNQLTFKAKTVPGNNFIRRETNITLGKDVSLEAAQQLCKDFGYEFNRSIFKTVFVYEYPRYVLSYYVVYTPDLQELGRFMEIEMSEQYPWKTEQEAWGELVALEAEAKVLGVTAQARMKKSLYEQFKR